MAVPKAFITDAELEVLKVLWSDNALTAREITTRLYGEENPSSIGTVQKLIQRLEEKDLLKRDRREPAHRFSAQVTRRVCRWHAIAGIRRQTVGRVAVAIHHAPGAGGTAEQEGQASVAASAG